MSLDLRIRRGRRRWRLGRRLWLLIAILLATGLLAWQQEWPPDEALAGLRQEVLSQVPAGVPAPRPQPSAPQSPPVVMVSSSVIENPHSPAYTAGLYQATGKDPIPWPNVAGRTELLIHVVESGDTLWSIAAQYDLDLDSLRWANPELERNPDVLSVGTELRILPVQGAYHQVSGDETIESIAALYGVAPADIAQYPPNALYPPYDLAAGQGLIVPFGRKGIELPQPSPSLEAVLAWPLVGSLTGTFDASHPALDIGAPYGSTVYAAEAGTVAYATWARNGYGYSVNIDHGEGRETWYNHLKGTLVSAGDVVYRGAPIGEVGSTGHSTGPHLHLEFHVDDQPVDPLDFLPGTTPQ